MSTFIADNQIAVDASLLLNVELHDRGYAVDQDQGDTAVNNEEADANLTKSSQQ